ncbi:MAG: signal transduction protein [Limisphaerales bacterium]|nr:MAG: signal transduction protein [Limisphaerales bacterium]
MKADELIAQVPSLPAPSPSVTRLLALQSQPEADIEEMVQVVERDGVLSAKLLGLCNSAHYGLAEQVGSVKQAVFYLGMGEVHRLVMSVCFGPTLTRSLVGFAIAEQELWTHSLLTALLTDSVLRHAVNVDADPALAYTAGLVHDIGKIVLNHTLTEPVQAAIRKLVEQDGCSRIQAERHVLDTDHAELGARLLARWNLPARIVEAVAEHHAPKPLPRASLSAVVHLANCLAHGLGSAPGWDGCAVPVNGEAVATLGFDDAKLQMLVTSGFDKLCQVKEYASLK